MARADAGTWKRCWNARRTFRWRRRRKRSRNRVRDFLTLKRPRARINFKSGPEKKPYALTNADFSLWQESENTWGVRLKAQPLRTDMNLNDTGLLQVSGTWQRAELCAIRRCSSAWSGTARNSGSSPNSSRETTRAGEERFGLDVTLAGTPAKLQISEQRHRSRIFGATTLRAARHCGWRRIATANTVRSIRRFMSLLCSAPVGSGLITLRGDVGLPGSHSYGLLLTAENVPASAVGGAGAAGEKESSRGSGCDGNAEREPSHRAERCTASKLQIRGRGGIRRVSPGLGGEQGGDWTGDGSVSGDGWRSRTMSRRSGLRSSGWSAC